VECQPGNLPRLSKFLSFAPQPPKRQQRIWASPTSDSLPGATLITIPEDFPDMRRIA
jgi:hypothetical protein